MVYRGTTYYTYEEMVKCIDTILYNLIDEGYNYKIKLLKKRIRDKQFSLQVTGMSKQQYIRYRELIAKLDA